MPIHRFAILSTDALGDSLYLAVIAYALADAGHDVTLISNPLAQLNNEVPAYQIRPYDEETTSHLIRADFILMCAGFKVQPVLDALPAEHHAKIVLSAIYKYNFDTALQADLHADHPFKAIHRKGLYQCYHSKLIIDNIRQCLLSCCGIQFDKPSIGLTPPANTTKKRQVLLHPSSRTPKRLWAWENWIVLADRLTQADIQVIWSVSANDLKNAPADFIQRYHPQPLSLSALAQACYESQLLIGHCSGPGHFASLLNCPTLGIIFAGLRTWRWRPCLGAPSYVARTPMHAKLIKPWISHHRFKQFLSVDQVYKQTLAIISNNEQVNE